MAKVGLWLQLLHLIGWAALGRSIHRALSYAEEAIKGDVSNVTEALASAGPVVGTTTLIALGGYAVLRIAVVKGGERANWIFWPGLLASLYYVLPPILFMAVFRLSGFPLSVAPGIVGAVHFVFCRKEYLRTDRDGRRTN